MTLPALSLTRSETAIGIALLLGMALFYLIVGGKPLAVTFVIGCLAAIGLIVLLYQQRSSFAPSERLMTLVLLGMCIQFLHFAEEYMTGFRTKFPALFGSEPISENIFVTFNMVHYAFFILSALAVFKFGRKVLLAPVLFFIVYGMMGNAITHTFWAVSTFEYFPGFFTALLYWPLGLFALFGLIGSLRLAAAFVAVFSVALLISVSFWSA